MTCGLPTETFKGYWTVHFACRPRIFVLGSPIQPRPPSLRGREPFAAGGPCCTERTEMGHGQRHHIVGSVLRGQKAKQPHSQRRKAVRQRMPNRLCQNMQPAFAPGSAQLCLHGSEHLKSFTHVTFRSEPHAFSLGPQQAPTNSPASPSPGCGRCSQPTYFAPV